MIPYVEFNYEWKEAMSDSESILVRIKREAASFKYLSFLQLANSSQIWLPACYVYPERYFWVKGEYLRLLGTNLSYRLGIIDRDGEDVRYPQELTEEDERTVSELYGIDPRFGRPSEMLSAIYNYLAYTETTPYYKALMEFKWRTGLLAFPLFDVRERIKNIDGKLVGYVWDRKQNGYSWRLLTSEVVEEEVEVTRNPTQQTGVHTPIENELKRRLRNGLLKLHEKEALDSETFRAGFSWGSVEYSLPISQQLNVYFDSSKLPYTPSKPYSKPVLSSKGLESLRMLTNGRIEQLDDIAELVARLFMPEKPSSYLWIICAKEKQPLLQFDQNTVSQFINWILCLTERRYGTAAYESDQEKRNKQLAEDQVLGLLFQMNPTPKMSADIKKMNRSWLKRFIQGEETGTLNDPYQKEQSITGKSVLLYVTTDFNEADFKNIPHKVIRVPKDWTFSDWTSEDIKWVQTCLLCHGLHIVLGQNVEHKTETITKDDVIRKFVREFCEDSPDSWIERKTFCKWLTEYGKAYFPTAGIKNESTKLGADVDKLLVWKPETIRENNNRLGYKGKHLNEEKLGEVLRQAAESRDEEKTSVDFDQYIASFSDLIKIQEQNP